MNIRTLLFSLATLATVGAMAAYPTVSNVSSVQRWPVSSDVDVYFTVNDDGDNCDFDLVATWDGNASGKIIGTVFSPGPGRQHYVWHTESLKIKAHDCSDIYDPVHYVNCIYITNEIRFAELGDAPLKNFSVEVRPAAISGKMFLSLKLKTGEVVYGATSPFDMSSKNTGNQTDRFVFRRVRAKDDQHRAIVYTNGYSEALNSFEFPKANGTWRSITNDTEGGSSSFTSTYGNQFKLREVTFSADYFIAVLPNTSGELHYMYRDASLFVGCNAVKDRSYNQLRGTVSQGINWPYSGFEVATNSYIAHFREFLKPMLGNLIFDLPTRAQLETAMRAGTDGNQIFAPDPSLGIQPITTAMAGDGAAITNVFNKLCVWSAAVPSLYANNENVGRAGANAWGIYDATGLQGTWVLDNDWKADDAGLDPVGYWRSATGSSPMTDSSNRMTMSVTKTITEIKAYIPGRFAGLTATSTGNDNARFVLNTKDWMADRVP